MELGWVTNSELNLTRKVFVLNMLVLSLVSGIEIRPEVLEKVAQIQIKNFLFVLFCTLNLDHNQLTSVPLGLPLSIKELYLKVNLIEQFRGGVFNGMSELVVLDLSANRLTNKGLHLESLNLEGTRLRQIP